MARELVTPEPAMRTYLRSLAGLLTVVATLLAVAAAGAAGHEYPAAGLTSVWFAAVPGFALLAAVGLLMFHLTGVVLPAPPGRGAGYRPVRWVLRVAAIVQMGVGGLVVGAAVVFAADRISARSASSVGEAFMALVVVFVASGATCVGGVLWCAVRLAYPEGWGDEE